MGTSFMTCLENLFDFFTFLCLFLKLLTGKKLLWYHKVPYGTIRYLMVPYGTIWYHKVPYGTIRYLTVPICSTFPFSILHFSKSKMLHLSIFQCAIFSKIPILPSVLLYFQCLFQVFSRFLFIFNVFVSWFHVSMLHVE